MSIEQMIEVVAPEMTPEQQEQAQQLLQERRAQRLERLEAFGKSLTRTRDKAKAFRASCGIELEWARSEDAYQGVDDANRGHVSRVVTKPDHEGGVVSAYAAQTRRSTVLLNITRPYVDAASARVGDMLLPVDDRPWGLEPTPVPDVGAPVDGMPAMGPDAQGMPQPMAQSDMAAQQADARTAAEGAAKQIEDWLVESQWHAEMRKMFDDAARLGTGVLKGPTPVRRKRSKVRMVDGAVQIEQIETVAPESRCISPWNCFPDPACGDDVQQGAYFWERDFISARQLRELKGLPGYLDEQIDKVLEDGPKPMSDYPTGRHWQDEERFEIWYYTGQAEREDLEAARVDLGDVPPGGVSIPCMAALVDGVVIQAALSPLDSGELPYDFLPWQKKEGLPWGTGVAMQLETPQRGLTAALRNLMDNAGVSAGAQVVVNRNAVTPADGRWELGGGMKFWYLQESAETNEVRKAFDVYTIPSMQQELQAIIQMFMKAAEDTTGMPQMLQGQLGTNSPDTFGGQVMLMNNAGAFLRRIARLADDKVTERHIGRYYEWLLLYGDNDAIKGDFQVNARGSTAMVEMALQTQFIQQMGQMVGNPEFGIDPQKWFAELLKSQRLDPARFQMDEQQMAERAQAAQQQPEAPQIAVARINAESREKTAQMQYQAAVEKMRLDTDRDTVYVQAQMGRDQANAQARAQELSIKHQLALLEYANREKVSLEKVKADLAREAMRIQSVERLAQIKAPSDALPKPPIEPPGQAPAGESWQK